MLIEVQTFYIMCESLLGTSRFLTHLKVVIMPNKSTNFILGPYIYKTLLKYPYKKDISSKCSIVAFLNLK